MTTTEIELRRALETYTGNGRVSREWIALLAPAAALAEQVAGTGFVPTAMRNNPAAIVAAILYGDELGLGPMQSLAKIAVIEGKPTLYAEAQRALILAAGHELRVDEATTTKVTVSGRRDGSSDWSSVTWSLDDAKRANLAGRQNWRAYPRQMLTARATAELARVLFADVIGGLAATEEIEDVDPLDAPAYPTYSTQTATATGSKRRRRKVAPKAEETPVTDSPGEPDKPGPELPPLPDEPAEPLSGPATDEPRTGIEVPPDGTVVELPADSPAEDILEIGDGERVAGGAGEVAQDDETTASSDSADSAEASPAVNAPLPTPKQIKALDSLVGQLREVEVELADGSKTRILSTEQLWASAARKRNVDVDVMIELLGGRDEVGRLHWSPLRDSLTRDEASGLIDTLTDRQKRWGV